MEGIIKKYEAMNIVCGKITEYNYRGPKEEYFHGCPVVCYNKTYNAISYPIFRDSYDVPILIELPRFKSYGPKQDNYGAWTIRYKVVDEWLEKLLLDIESQIVGNVQSVIKGGNILYLKCDGPSRKEYPKILSVIIKLKGVYRNKDKSYLQINIDNVKIED